MAFLRKCSRYLPIPSEKDPCPTWLARCGNWWSSNLSGRDIAEFVRCPKLSWKSPQSTWEYVYGSCDMNRLWCYPLCFFWKQKYWNQSFVHLLDVHGSGWQMFVSNLHCLTAELRNVGVKSWVFADFVGSTHSIHFFVFGFAINSDHVTDIAAICEVNGQIPRLQFFRYCIIRLLWVHKQKWNRPVFSSEANVQAIQWLFFEVMLWFVLFWSTVFGSYGRLGVPHIPRSIISAHLSQTDPSVTRLFSCADSKESADYSPDSKKKTPWSWIDNLQQKPSNLKFWPWPHQKNHWIRRVYHSTNDPSALRKATRAQ